MHIQRVVIENYRCLPEADVRLNPGMNILVGDNETGKSTFLEAVHLALTGQLYGRSALYELHPFLFNSRAVDEYLQSLRTPEPKPLPEILIELYFDEDDRLALWQGANNSLNLDSPGVSFKIQFNQAFKADYERYVANPGNVLALPIEYYEIQWLSFSFNAVSPRGRPMRSVIVDATTIRGGAQANRYISEIIEEYLPRNERVDLSLSYRAMKSRFLEDERVKAVNARLAAENIGMTDKTLSLSLDTTARANWETGILPHLDDIPMPFVGKGEQNSVKIRLAIDSAAKTDVILIEEPENHLSHSNLGRLLTAVEEAAKTRQVLATSHSSFVINKLGVDTVLLFANSKFMRISNLKPSTRDFFVKLPGHDTLRLILSRKCILVEGPSDELIVQKAYVRRYGKMPLNDGVEVISVALSFLRFLEIAENLGSSVAVVTDNDGKPERVAAKYADYSDSPNMRICTSDDAALPSLEQNVVHANGLALMNTILGRAFATEDELIEYMKGDKAGWALKFFESEEDVKFPAYIENAIE